MGVRILEEQPTKSSVKIIGGGKLTPGKEQKNPITDPTILGSETLGDIFVRPGASVRATLMSFFNDEGPLDAFQRGSVRPGDISYFQDIALDKFAPKTPSVLVNFLGGIAPSAAGLAADIITSPADVALMLTGNLVGPRLAKTAAGKSVEQFMTKERTLGKTAEQLTKQAQDLTVKVLQPLKNELANTLDRGNQLPAVREASKFIRESKSFTELRKILSKTIDDVFTKRNKILEKNNRPVGEGYMDELRRFVEVQKNKGQFKDSEIREMESVLNREQLFFKNRGGSPGTGFVTTGESESIIPEIKKIPLAGKKKKRLLRALRDQRLSPEEFIDPSTGATLSRGPSNFAELSEETKIKFIGRKQAKALFNKKLREKASPKSSGEVGSRPSTFDRLAAQKRKEFFQNRTENILKKRELGTITEKESARALAEDKLRAGLKRVVEMGDPVIAELNSTYGGLLRARKLVAAQEAIASKEVKSGNAILRVLSSLRSKSEAARSTADAVLRQGDLRKNTLKIERLMRSARKKTGAKTALDEFLP